MHGYHDKWPRPRDGDIGGAGATKLCRSVLTLIVLPVAAVAFYFAAWRLAPEVFLRGVASEQGLVELGTAALFAASSYLAARLSLTANGVPSIYRVLYAVFAVA